MEKSKQTMTLKNGKLVELSRLYRKISSVEMDFDMLDQMMTVVDDSIIIETALKVYQKLEEKLKEDTQSKMKDKTKEEQFEIEQDFIKKINALVEKESSLERPLNKVTEDILKKAKATISDIKVLKELNLLALTKK